ncbi:Protease inhibitor seed storage LTP family protein precursor [Musa troglodytarum]|nr:Protease inhibitor seed storage LTP family protein precursor [Musa troglodytarum]
MSATSFFVEATMNTGRIGHPFGGQPRHSNCHMNRSSLARLATSTTAAPEMEMTTTTTAFATALIAAAALSGPASAQPGCTSVIMSLSPCMSFIRERGVGPPAAPSAACCTQLGSAVRSQPTCLCAVLNGDAASFGLAINKTQALALPGACKVNTPPLSQCSSRCQRRTGGLSCCTAGRDDPIDTVGSRQPSVGDPVDDARAKRRFRQRITDDSLFGQQELRIEPFSDSSALLPLEYVGMESMIEISMGGVEGFVRE